ncbi:hypothetical protein GGF32_009596 [Allomyces javanicus]|nr:hypothetical protein GGF32_009596 [Allomyces javanicus]
MDQALALVWAAFAALVDPAITVWAYAKPVVLGTIALGVAYVLYAMVRTAMTPDPFVLHSVGDLRVATGRRGRRDPSTPASPSPAARVNDSDAPGSVWSWREYLRLTCPAWRNPFRATPYLFNAHLQTIHAALGRLNGRAEYDRDFLTMPDGGEIAIDWSRPKGGVPYRSTTPTVVILHGLTGGSNENYVQDLVSFLASPPYGYRCIVVNSRGCAESDLKTPQLYNGAYTDDFRFAMKHLQKCLPHAKMAAIGFSLGSNILVKYLGEEGKKAPFVGAVSVCNPFDFVMSNKRLLQTRLHRVYSRALASNLKKAYLKHAHVIRRHPKIHHGRIMNSKHIWEFDDRVTRIVFGYMTVEDYYADASSCNYISKIRVPLLCFNALDDPISPLEAIPFRAADENPWVMIGTTRTGGHIGHYTGWLKPERWCTAIYGQYLSAVLEAEAIVPVPDPAATDASDFETDVDEGTASDASAAIAAPVKPGVSGRDSAVQVSETSASTSPVPRAEPVSATSAPAPATAAPAPTTAPAPTAEPPASRALPAADADAAAAAGTVARRGLPTWLVTPGARAATLRALVQWIMQNVVQSRRVLVVLLVLLGVRRTFK